MTITTKKKIIPQTARKKQPLSSELISRWRAQLHDRGITDQVIDRAGIRPAPHGWLYPIDPNITARRLKAYPGQRGPKYQWKPGKPHNARFYDPAGDLVDHVAAAAGVLILAAGEPDVWACWSAGIYNVTCTLHGEGTIPPWLIEQLIALQVHQVEIWPDCDRAGMNHAIKVRAALAASGIALAVYALPFELGSKGDLNHLLIQVGLGSFRAALESCELLTRPAPEMSTQVDKPRRSDLPSDYSDLYERWCVEIVEAAAIQAWNITPANGKNLSRRNFSSPLREDRKPSAQWNYTAHGFKDYATGDFHNTATCGELLGVQSWEDFKQQHAPEINKAKASLQKETAAPDLLYDQPRDPDVRLEAWHWSEEYRSLLLNLHNQFSDTYEDLGDLVLLLDRVIVAAESRGLIALGAPLAEKDIEGLNTQLGYPLGDGYVRGPIRRGLAQGLRLGFFVQKTRKKDSLNTLRDLCTKNSSDRQRGDRGPSQVFILRDQVIAHAYLVACISNHALRAEHYAPPGDPFFAPDELHAGPDYGLTAAEAAAANAGRAALFEQYAAERDRARRKWESAARVLAQQLAESCQAANHAAAALPEDTPTPNKAAYRTALIGLHHDQGKIMIVPNRARIHAVGFRSENQLRLAREKLGIKADKRHKKHPVNRSLPVLEQLPGQPRRGWGWRLEASNGQTFEITRRDLDYVESWAARQFEAGATITALEQTASVWREATPQEKHQAAACVEARREKQREYREKRKALGLDSAPSAAPVGAAETPLDRLPERYTLKQVMFELDRYTDHELTEGALKNRRTGETISQPTIRDLALAWVKAPPVIISEGVAVMPTFTAHAEPIDSAPDVERESEDRQPSEPLHLADLPLWQLTGVSEETARAHHCENCGKPAAGQNLVGGWRCIEHWRGLQLAEQDAAR